MVNKEPFWRYDIHPKPISTFHGVPLVVVDVRDHTFAYRNPFGTWFGALGGGFRRRRSLRARTLAIIVVSMRIGAADRASPCGSRRGFSFPGRRLRVMSTLDTVHHRSVIDVARAETALV